jgi:hypothetical protein
MGQTELKKFVLEWRYKPDLKFYGEMDSLGEDLASKYPEWQRSALSLEMRNTQKHRRVLFSFDRSFFEWDEPHDTVMDIDAAAIVMQKMCRKLSMANLSRVGLRQWFAYSADEALEVLVELVSERLLLRTEKLDGILGGTVRDVAYVLDLKDEAGWKYNLRLGPMEKKQWFQITPHDPVMYEPDDQGKDDAKTLKEFRRSFPSNFIYMDIDCFYEDCSADKAFQFVTNARRKSQKLAKDLISYLREK